MAQIPKGRLAKGQYKLIYRDCAMYFSITVESLELHHVDPCLSPRLQTNWQISQGLNFVNHIQITVSFLHFKTGHYVSLQKLLLHQILTFGGWLEDGDWMSRDQKLTLGTQFTLGLGLRSENSSIFNRKYVPKTVKMNTNSILPENQQYPPWN